MSDDLIDLPGLDAWIGEQLPGFGEPLTAERLGATTGIANALYLIRRGDHEWVLRRPPAVKNDPSASDTLREWRILRALDETPVPHPTARLICQDLKVLGSPFLVMDVVVGFTPGFELPPPFDEDPGLRYELAMSYVDGCAELSKVDWEARGLTGLGKPEGFLDRQVPRWLAQLRRYQTREIPGLDFVTEWLAAHQPAMSAPAILHGDYSPFNVMVVPEPPARLAAIVDWDTGTIGDPLLDIGHLLARWTEPGEESVIGEQAGGTFGYPSRAEMAARYAERTGRDLSALPFYEALALFKLAVILEGTYTRQRAAGVTEEDNIMAPMVPRLITAAAEFARGERI